MDFSAQIFCFVIGKYEVPRVASHYALAKYVI